MDHQKPELVAFSQNLMGGVQTFFYNLLTNDAEGDFDKKWLLIRWKGCDYAHLPKPFGIGEQIVNYDQDQGRWRVAKRISKFISNKDGLILANYPTELDSLMLYPKPNKTVFHLVHDYTYLDFAKTWEDVIDVFVTHNYELYEDLQKRFPDKKNRIFYLPYGIKLSSVKRIENRTGILEIAFLARLHKTKGIYDLLKIDDLLIQNNIRVKWTIMGDGQEKENFLREINSRKNFTHHIPETTEQIFQKLQRCDIFVLPSSLDGTPVALLESMSVGLVPVVYNFNNGIKKIISEEIGYIVNDYQEMYEKIVQLHQDRSLLETKSNHAKVFAENNFNVVDKSRDYYQLFKRYKEFRRTDKKNPPRMPLKENPNIPFPVMNFILRLKRKLFRIFHIG